MRRWWRRKRSPQPPGEPLEHLPAGDPAGGSEPADTPGAALPAIRVERALVALAVHAQQIEDRLARLERQVADQDQRAVDAAHEVTLTAATQDDLLSVQVHSAKVAAELSRLSINLQARIDDLAVQVPHAPADDRRQQRARVLAESILDLSERLEPEPLDLRSHEDSRRTA